MIKLVLRRIFSGLGWAKAIVFLGNKIGPEGRFAWTADIRYSKLEGRNYIGRRSVVHKCQVGENSYMGDDCRMISAQIGKFTAIGSGVKTSFGRHPYHFISQHPATYSVSGETPSLASRQFFAQEHKYAAHDILVIIGHDVWIGDDVKILDGVKVGHGSVIGANSLVTRDVPPYAIVYGTPAKIIKYRFKKKAISKLLNLEWWLWNRSALVKAIKNERFCSSIYNPKKKVKNNSISKKIK